MQTAGTRNADYGRGVHTIAIGRDALITSEELAERMRQVFRSADYRPPALPRVGMQLLNLSRQSDVSFAAVLELLEQDAMIAGRVLARAQSSAYAGATRVTSLHQALVRLGLETLTSIVLEESISLRMFRVKAYAKPMEALRKHSAAVARAARLVAGRTSIPHDYAFMCGLLHDSGVAACISALSFTGGKPAEWSLIMHAVHQAHDEVSGLLADLWGLPADVCMALRAHHRQVIGGHVHPMAAIICLGDHLAHELGYQSIGVPEVADIARARLALNIDDRLWHVICQQAVEALADIR